MNKSKHSTALGIRHTVEYKMYRFSSRLSIQEDRSGDLIGISVYSKKLFAEFILVINSNLDFVCNADTDAPIAPGQAYIINGNMKDIMAFTTKVLPDDYVTRYDDIVERDKDLRFAGMRHHLQSPRAFNSIIESFKHKVTL